MRKQEYNTFQETGYAKAIDEGADYCFASPSSLIVPNDERMIAKAQSLFAPSHTVNNSDTYSNLGCVSLSESALDNMITSLSSNDFYITGAIGNTAYGTFTTFTTTLPMAKFHVGQRVKYDGDDGIPAGEYTIVELSDLGNPRIKKGSDPEYRTLNHLLVSEKCHPIEEKKECKFYVGQRIKTELSVASQDSYNPVWKYRPEEEFFVAGTEGGEYHIICVKSSPGYNDEGKILREIQSFVDKYFVLVEEEAEISTRKKSKFFPNLSHV